MADALPERFTQSIRCLICARPARRGATLCAQCKAALRRPRHIPSDKPAALMPSRPVVRTEPRRLVQRKNPYSRAVRGASRAAAPPALGGWGTYATIIAFGLAVCLTGYLAIGEGERASYAGGAAGVSAAPAEPREDTTAKASDDASAPAPAPSLVVEAEPSYEAISDEHLSIFESLSPVSRATQGGKLARATRSAKGANATVAATTAHKRREATRDVATASATAPTATPVALVELAVSDRWERYLSELSRCEQENVIIGLVCKERARLQYCEGEWGAAPECPVAVASRNTR